MSQIEVTNSGVGDIWGLYDLVDPNATGYSRIWAMEDDLGDTHTIYHMDGPSGTATDGAWYIISTTSSGIPLYWGSEGLVDPWSGSWTIWPISSTATPPEPTVTLVGGGDEEDPPTVYLGTQPIESIYLGTREIGAVFLGYNKMWPDHVLNQLTTPVVTKDNYALHFPMIEHATEYVFHVWDGPSLPAEGTPPNHVTTRSIASLQTSTRPGNDYMIGADRLTTHKYGATIAVAAAAPGYMTSPTSDPILYTWCLLVEAPIMVAYGVTKRLGQIDAGDTVLSINPATSRLESMPVTYADDTSLLIRVHLYYFDDGTTIPVVMRHRFYNYDQQAYVYLHEWSLGDRMLKYDKSLTKLISKGWEMRNATWRHIVTPYNNYIAYGGIVGRRDTLPLNLEEYMKSDDRT